MEPLAVTPLRAKEADGPRMLLAEHHRGLQLTCQALIACALDGEPGLLLVRFRRFEHRVHDYIDVEWELVLPELESANPEEGAEIREQHVDLRAVMYRVAIDVELEHARVASLRHLLALLVALANREAGLLHPWVERHLPMRLRRAVYCRLAASLWKLAALLPPPTS